MERKSDLRKKYLKIRDEMPYEERLSDSHDIMESVVSSFDFLSAKNILIYASTGSEVITKGIMEYAFMLKKKVFCPTVTSENEMDFYEIHAWDDLKEGYKGILEPAIHKENMFSVYTEEKTLVLLPGVCFDEKGHRIGYGKGFYDRYLIRFPSGIKMALCYECQIEDEIPFEENDILYDLLVTPFRTICLLEEEEEC